MKNYTTEADVNFVLPVLGLGTPLFYITHYSALVSIAISICFTLGTIIYMSRTTKCGEFWKWPVSSRLVTYLSISDILRDISHSMDHAAYVFYEKHPPDVLCKIFAYFLQEFTAAQSLVVMLTAVGAFLMVAKSAGFNLGKFDWRLLLFAYGAPAVLGGAFLYFGFLGPSGAW